jgi:ribosomal protein L37AE/L43A
MTADPQAKAVSQQSPRLEPADCTATNSGTHAGENVPIAGDTGMHSAAQRNAIPEANVRKTVAKADEEQSQTCPRCERGTVKRRTGDMWWQVQSLRCSWCRGTGQIRSSE